MRRILTAIFFLCSLATFAQTNDTTKYINYRYTYGNRMPRYLSDSVLGTLGALQVYAATYTSSATAGAARSFNLGTISSDQTITIPSPSSAFTGSIIFVQNKNASAYQWNVSGSLTEADGTAITSLPKGLYIFRYDGSNWIRLSTGSSSVPTGDTLTFSSPLQQTGKNVSFNYDALPNDTVQYKIYGDSLYYIVYYGARGSTPAYRDSVPILGPADATRAGLVTAAFANIRPDYIRNQYTSRESKQSWTQKARSDSSITDSILIINSQAYKEIAPLGFELLSSSGWTSTGWTGSFGAGWTHSTGNTTALSNTLAAVVGNYYYISWTITGRTAGTVTLTFGGVSTAIQTTSQNFAPQALTTGNLIVAPTTDFDGTITISIKQITGTTQPVFRLFNSAGVPSYEIRSSNTTYITSLGVGALSRIITAARGVAVGDSAAANATSGKFFVAMGYKAGYSNSINGGYVAIGDQASMNNTSGSNYVAVGRDAALSSTTGGSFVAIGNQAGKSATTATDWVAIGNQAGGNNIANSNLFIGTNAGGSTTSSTNVTYIGTYAGLFATGNNNTIIGGSAGRFQADGATGYNPSGGNITIFGASARGFNNSDVNSIIIGANAIGAGTNSATIGDNNITATYLKGAVSIGKTWTTSAPSIASNIQFLVESTTKGSVPAPIMTTTQRDAISTPTTGMQVYDNVVNKPSWYNGTRWVYPGTSGTATLVAGTVTVSTSAVTSASKIYLTVNTPGGTQGFLSAPAASRTALTSFVINSTSATETSTVDWFIVNY